MIFVAAANEPTMVIMLSEQDVMGMRQGQYRFVDERATKGHQFNKCVVCLYKTDAESLAALKKSQGGVLPGQVTEQMVTETKATEERCFVCKGVGPIGSLYEDKCITCWAVEAKRLRLQGN